VARTIWTGVISFGLVSVPVGLYPAVEEHAVTFHQFEKGTTDRVRYRRVNERTGDELDYDDIERGAPIGGGNYVMVDDEELEFVAPGRSRSLDIYAFVGLDEIDPMYFHRPYYVGPTGAETVKTYALLRDAMADTNKAGIGKFVMRGKEHLAAIRPYGAILVVETMFFADEIRDPASAMEYIPGRVSARGQERQMATQLIDSMSGTWRPSDYGDTYTGRINDLIASKHTGGQFTPTDEAPEPTNVIDLVAALQASIDRSFATRSSRSGKRAAAKPSSERQTRARPGATAKSSVKKSSVKKTVAKKAPAKKSPPRKAS
jgi:DNA end-binding protein Ku